jgi:hypothetical protein
MNVVELLFNRKGRKTSEFSNWLLSNIPHVTPDNMLMKTKKNSASRLCGE